ncbi:hypothetical protein FRC11_013858 [Ceratobasidium sp. 423]|nr:hypothetical protein FRC11_013858 [Ceratobasidium sp. 423]
MVSQPIFNHVNSILWASVPTKALIRLLRHRTSIGTTEVHLDRWKLYAPHVQTLHVAPLAITSEEYRVLLKEAVDQPLLPKLKSLSMQPAQLDQSQTSDEDDHPYEHCWEPKCPNNWTHAMHLAMLALGPTLLKLDLSFTGALLPDFNVILTTRAPQLSHLQLSYGGDLYQPDKCNAILNYWNPTHKAQQKTLGYAESHNGYSILGSPSHISNYYSLQELTVTGDILVDINLLNVALLPQLHTLTIVGPVLFDDWDAYSADHDPTLFPSLKYLKLVNTALIVATHVFSVSCMLQSLLQLYWAPSYLSEDMLDHALLPPLLVQALKALVKASTNLHTLYVESGEFAEEPVQLESQMGAITQLLGPLWVYSGSNEEHVHQWQS